ncbi:DegV family protein [Rothia nasimurium]|uniref:DegV family protein n=1 Tax=Rothia nasimurium TaxID=85336 RepID=UPI001F00AC2C|nr:DegV family protein [Rothia nasimurium]
MRTIAIVTDSSSALPDSLLQQMTQAGGFLQLELPVMIGERPTHDLSREQLDEAIAMAHIQGEQVSTSGVAPGVLIDAYEELAAQGFQAVISIHLSSELSGTVSAARLAARTVDIPVAVVDSLSLAMGLGEPVRRLYQVLSVEDDLERAAALAEELCAGASLYFFIPTLDALKRGGRVNPALAMVGQMFQIRPVATVVDGRLMYVERPRTTPRAIERLISLTVEESGSRDGELPEEVVFSSGDQQELFRRSGRVVAIHYSGNVEQAHQLKADLGDIADEAYLSPLPPVLAAHAGLGALATVVY